MLLPAADKLAEMGTVVRDMTELKSIDTIPGRLPADKDEHKDA